MSGGFRRPSNARVTCCEGVGIGAGTRSSDMERRESSSAGAVVIVCLGMGRLGMRFTESHACTFSYPRVGSGRGGWSRGAE